MLVVGTLIGDPSCEGSIATEEDAATAFEFDAAPPSTPPGDELMLPIFVEEEAFPEGLLLANNGRGMEGAWSSSQAAAAPPESSVTSGNKISKV